MASQSATRTQLPIAFVVAGVLAVLVAIGSAIYLVRAPVHPSNQASATAEAKAYLPNLRLSDVSMKATLNFMQQQVVEVEGKIANNGPRPVQSVDVYCLFYGVDGREVHRERVPIVPAKGTPLKPGETRSFRLPFDALPDTWNQALPRMAIAQITFAQ